MPERRPVPCCGGDHPPDDPDRVVVFRGQLYTEPFRCLCCGTVICARQFSFGRACGWCDTGACRTAGHPLTEPLLESGVR